MGKLYREDICTGCEEICTARRTVLGRREVRSWEKICIGEGADLCCRRICNGRKDLYWRRDLNWGNFVLRELCAWRKICIGTDLYCRRSVQRKE